MKTIVNTMKTMRQMNAPGSRVAAAPRAARLAHLAAVFVVASTLSAAAENYKGTPQPALRAAVTVSGDLVRIGDLIDHAGEAADIAIFRAPDPGTTGAVPARRVLDAAIAHRLYGVDTRGLPEVKVTREGRMISTHDIETRIAEALAGHYGFGAAENLSLTFDREPRALHAEAQVTAALHVARQVYDARSGRFDVILELPGSTAFPRGTLRYTGNVFETVEAVVPTRALARGEIVRAGDVTLSRLRKSDVGGDVIVDAVATVGKAARTALRSGQALRSTDLIKPDLVARNDSITLVFEVPGITLTSRGKALESGAEGDIIAVQNVQSKRSIQATVVAPGTAVVVANRTRFTSAASSTPIATARAEYK